MHGQSVRPLSPSSPPCHHFHHARKHFRTPTTPDPTSAIVRQTHRFPERRREKSAIFGLPPDRRHPRLSNAPAQDAEHSRLLPLSCGLKELPTAPSFSSLMKAKRPRFEAVLESSCGDKHSKQPRMKLFVGRYVSLKACVYTVPYPLFHATFQR